MLDVVRIAGEDGVSALDKEREGRVRDIAGVCLGEQETATARGEFIERELDEPLKCPG